MGHERVTPAYTGGVTDARRRAVAQFATRVRRELGDTLADLRLFGSEARGDASPDSDIDVLLIVRPDDARIAVQDRAIDIAFDVNLEHGVYISPTVVAAGVLRHPVWRETGFVRNVVSESVPL